MSSVPNIWNIGVAIPINIFVFQPGNGVALTGQDGYLTLTISRQSVPGSYWNSSTNAWQIGVYNIVSPYISEVDSVNQPGRYIYVLPPAGNYQADVYTAHIHINNPPIITADDYDVHSSSNLTPIVVGSGPVFC